MPINPITKDTEVRRPLLTDVLESLSHRISQGLRVCLPCEVATLHGNQQVDLRVLVKSLHVSLGELEFPIIPLCPVSMPQGADWSVKYPLAVGDTGYAIFCDSALDDWLNSGKVVAAADRRQHSLTDAIFVPGLVPFAQQTQDSSQDFVIRNGTAQIRLEKNGTFRVANQGQELVDLISQMNQAIASLVSTLQQAQTITMLGPQSLWQATQLQLTQSASTISTIATHLATLKGE